MSTLSLRKIKHDSSAVDNITLVSDGTTGFGTTTPDGKVDIEVGSGVNLALTKATGASLSFNDGSQTRAAFQGINGADGLTIHTGSTWTERMRIDAAGRVTTPYQPFFAGYHNNQYATTYTGGNVIPVSIAITNTGNHFNTSNYTFTCPVDGIYEVIMSDISTASDTAGLGVYVNGSVKTKFYMQSVRQRFHASMFFASANDAITFRVAEGSCTLYGDSNYGRYQIRLVG